MPYHSRTAFDAFAATARAYPDNSFLCVPPRRGRSHDPDGIEFSYGAALARVETLRALYADAGIGPGHRVALLLGNRPEHFFHLLALNALGAGIVPVNPDHTAEEMRYQLEHSEADLAVASGERVAELRAVAARCPATPPVYDGDDLPARLAAPRRPAANGRPGRTTEAALLYTSGTTGKPKGCILTNEYFHTAGGWYLSRGGLLQMKHGRERLFNPFPVFHMNAGVLSPMALIRSANCLILADRFHPGSWWQDVVATGATAIHYMGVIPPLLFKQAPVPEERQHQVRFGLGAGIDPALHADFERRFGFPMVEVWGMTETGRILADHLEPRRTDSRAIGRPNGELEVRLIDEHGQPVAGEGSGELLLRCAGDDPRRGFFSGYLKNEEATEQAWSDGWFHTGDVVRRDGDGLLHFVDRRKNIIRRSGENIAAAEVEAAMITHPQVLSVAVLAITDELRDEEVMACVVPTAGAATDRATAEGIFAHCREQLAYYKAPGWIVFRDKLPTTTTSKVQKTLIFADGEDPRTAAGAFDLRELKRR